MRLLPVYFPHDLSASQGVAVYTDSRTVEKYREQPA